MEPFVFSLMLIFAAFLFLFSAWLFENINVPLWNWILLAASSILLIVLSLVPQGRKAMNRWLEKDKTTVVLRDFISGFALLLLYFYLSIFLFSAFFGFDINSPSLAEFARSSFVLLVAASALCFGALRAFAVFEPEDFPKRKQEHDFAKLKQSLFGAGLNLFLAAATIAIAAILKFYNDKLMESAARGVSLLSNLIFAFGYAGNIIVFVLFFSFFFQMYKGLTKLFNTLKDVKDELRL